MRRTAFTALAAAAVATGAIGVPAADAASLQDLINANPQFLFEDNSAEGLGVDENQNGRLDERDTLRGVFSFENFVPRPNGPATPLDGTTNSALHGLFEIQVADKTEVSPGVFTYDFQPYVPFATRVARRSINGGDPVDGATAALWESNTQLDPFSCGNRAECESSADNGTLRLVLGFDEDTDVWGAGPVQDDLEAARDIAVGSNIGQYGFRMSVLGDNLDVLPFIEQEALSIIAGQEFSDPAEVIGSGQILGSAGTNSDFQAFNDADIQMAVVPVPAALPLFLAGLGALGMIGWRRNAV